MIHTELQLGLALVALAFVDRGDNHDPRPSIEERYPSKDDFLQKIGVAAKQLAGDGYILEQDIPELLQRAGREWDYATGGQ